MANSGDDNEAVFCPATLKLGEMHWHILRASQLMYERTTLEIKVGVGSFVRHEDTDFGKEVGRDEIDWWVFRKESDIEELRKKTAETLEAAQKLKNTSRNLRREEPTTYTELLKVLRQFAESHEKEIDTLLRYARWLYSRDPLAPAILFTYRVWGSTRAAERTLKIDPTESKPQTDTVRILTEIVLGLRLNAMPAFFRAKLEISEEIWSSAYDEETSAAAFDIPPSRIVRRASALAFDECGEYFELIRDSLRNILLDVDKFIEQRNFVNDDAFWRAFIEKVASTPKRESQLWDCKKTLTMWHVDKNPQRDQAKATFSEDVAGFANAQGGVLVVGVTDNREVVGIGGGHELENKLKFAADVLAKNLEYPRQIPSKACASGRYVLGQVVFAICGCSRG